MTDPVIADDNHTYERIAITEWLNKNDKSPVTREKISKNLGTNFIVRSILSSLGHPLTSLGDGQKISIVLDRSGSSDSAIKKNFLFIMNQRILDLI